MGFSLWHWLIVTGVTVFLFRRKIFRLIGYLTDPNRALRESLGLSNLHDRRPTAKTQLKGRSRGWLFVLAAVLILMAWSAIAYMASHPWP
jgi:hypothetical protein